ncbi:uncharacterized protein LOC112201941 [Rosa chinensis]|uniref:uncharacterized protein LOC112201941 n=1 Tax=Rosa chinensis TaxID=74649 RepID=UPI001AD91219|nr:uncharacterized protein LOC112201941 [Rosa chinensis]
MSQSVAADLFYIFKCCSALQDLPSDVGEAMASLIYAASRCGELPDLPRIRCLFKERYGSEFDITSAELRHGNLVNPQLKEKLGITRIPDEVKQELIGDIVTKANIRLALQDVQDTIHQNYSFPDKSFKYEQKADGIQIQVPKSEMGRKPDGIFCSLSKGKLSVATAFPSYIGSNNGSGSSGPMTDLARKGSNGKRDGSKRLMKSKCQTEALPYSSHVHPKFPEYDDVVAKLGRLKAEHSRRKTFAFSDIFEEDVAMGYLKYVRSKVKFRLESGE